MMSAPIVTVTLNPCIDKTFSVERVIPEQKLVARDVRYYPGGGGINVARVIVRLSGRALALWSGGGATGELLARLLDQERVPHAQLPTGAAVRENSIVCDVSIGQQYRFGMPGAELNEQDRIAWQELLDCLDGPPGYVVFSGSLPPGASPDWHADLIHAASRRSRVIVDTKREALERALDRGGIYLIKPNIRELNELFGHDIEDDDTAEECARRIIGRGGAQVVLVSLGRAGALLVTADMTERFVAPAVPLRSKVGAGDSMVGGLTLALTRGWSLTEAARFGVAAGSATVMSEGTELCRREDVERLYERMRPEDAAA